MSVLASSTFINIKEETIMKMKWKGWALAAGTLLLATGATQAAPTAEMLSDPCAGCHGTYGNSAGTTTPTLASHSKQSLVDAMKKFKSGERPATIMGRIAKGYGDGDFEAMGDFFSKQKFHAANQPFDKKKAARGAELHSSNCARCHLEDGKEGKDASPVMAGQWLDYLKIEMGLYTSGKRKMSDEKKEKVQPLSATDLEALLHYYASVTR